MDANLRRSICDQLKSRICSRLEYSKDRVFVEGCSYKPLFTINLLAVKNARYRMDEIDAITEAFKLAMSSTGTEIDIELMIDTTNKQDRASASRFIHKYGVE